MVEHVLKTYRVGLEVHNQKDHLKRKLEDSLRHEYTRGIQSGLRNDLMRAFFRGVGTDPANVDLPFEETTYQDLQNPDIKPKYGTQHALVTALNHYLANQGIREDEPIKSLSMDVLASMIAALRQDELHTPLPFPDATQDEIRSWMSSVEVGPGSEHYVYILDCTPTPDATSINEREIDRVKEKQKRGISLDSVEQAIYQASQSNSVYYVGYAQDVLKRFRDHQGGGTSGSANFLITYSPTQAIDVFGYETKTRAQKCEKRITKKFNESYVYDFAYYN